MFQFTDVSFFVPGTGGSAPATVSGFGAVFTDVDLAMTTSIQFFGVNNNLLDELFVEVGTGDKNLSFLGAIGDADEQIARVRIMTGNTGVTILSRWTILFMGSLRVCLSRAASS